LPKRSRDGPAITPCIAGEGWPRPLLGGLRAPQNLDGGPGGGRSSDSTNAPNSPAEFDRDGATDLLIGYSRDRDANVAIRRRFPWLELIWADGGYNAWQVDATLSKVPLLRMEIVKRSDEMKGFVVLLRRWVVERTFSWFGRNRHLAKDFENLAETLGQLSYPGLHPARRQTARQGVGREYDKLTAR
jgi:transposase